MDTQHRAEAGQDLIEFALVLPVLLLLLLGIMEFGIIIFSYNTVANAAREGARLGVLPISTQADVRAQTCRKLAGVVDEGACLADANLVDVQLEQSTVTVEVTYEHSLITGYIVQAVGGEPHVTLHTVTTMQRE